MNQLQEIINPLTEDQLKGICDWYNSVEPLEDDEGGLLVYERDNYRVKALSAYVPQVFVERYGLQVKRIAAGLHKHPVTGSTWVMRAFSAGRMIPNSARSTSGWTKNWRAIGMND